MTPEQFAYWLQGFAEIHNSAPTSQEWEVIKDHLGAVFNKITPNRTTFKPIVNDPTKPDPIRPVINPWPNTPWPGDSYPGNPITPWTSPTYPRPEIICSTKMPGAGTNWSSGAGSTAYCMASTAEIPTVKYDYFTTAKKETISKINKELSR